MQFLFDIINKPLAWVLQNLATVFGGNFAAAVFVFTLLINLALVPLSIKSQKSSVQQTRIKPKLDDLKKRYGDDYMSLPPVEQRVNHSPYVLHFGPYTINKVKEMLCQ